MRTVFTPAGDEWEVGVEWEARHLSRPGSRLRGARDRLGRWRRRRGDSTAEAAGEGIFALADVGVGAYVGIAILVLALLWFVLPIWTVAIVAGVELSVIVVLCALAFVARTLLRRPWTVVARTRGPGDDVRTWPVVGWRRARRHADAVADQLARVGTTPPAPSPPAPSPPAPSPPAT